MAKKAVKRRTELAFQDDRDLLTPGPVRDRLLDQMAKQGGESVRMNVIYGKVKREGLGPYAALVDAIRKRGMTPQMTLMGTPRYNPDDDQALSYRNTDPRLMQQFATEVAGHFKGRVGRYSIWNEPNYPGFIEGADKDPKKAAVRYRHLYRAGYAGVKKADPSAQVLLGEMTSSPGTRTFLKNVLAGKPLKTAGFAFHPYDQPPAAVAGSDTWDIDTLKGLQAELAAHKRSGKLQTAKGNAAPLYLTEFGYQRGETSAPIRLKKLAVAYAKAKQSGARQFLQYQATPKQRPMTPGAVSTDAYGNQSQGAAKPGWVWDTGIGDAAGNLPIINQGLRLSGPRARVARKRKR